MTHPVDTPDTASLTTWLPYIEQQLGRSPRGLRAIAAFNGRGQPAVIRVASVVDGKPFPTLFWLIDPALNLAIDRLEAAGTIAHWQSDVAASVSLREQMARDHRAHQQLRNRFLTTEERGFLAAAGMLDALDQRGIGGIADPDRIRCLHTWDAAHCVQPNVIGARVDAVLNQSTTDLNLRETQS